MSVLGSVNKRRDRHKPVEEPANEIRTSSCMSGAFVSR